MFKSNTLFLSQNSTHRSDQLLIWALRLAAALAGAIVLLIFIFLLRESLPLLNRLGVKRFFLDDSWHPTENLFNLSPMILGTLMVTMASVAIATPLGVLSAVFCHYYAPPKIADVYRRLIELLAGIPSVVYGFWGLVVLVPLIGQIRPPGSSLLAGTLILSIMILPTIALVADSSFSNVPESYIRGSEALGLSRWRMVRSIVFPSAKAGLFTGVILETGRAIGETMAILMVCGNIVQVPKSFFDPMRTLTSNMALEMAYAMGDHRAALFVSGLILMLMIVVLVSAAEWLSRGKIYG